MAKVNVLSLLLIVVSGCMNMRLEKWTTDKKSGVISVLLCSACSSPYEYQTSDARNVMKSKCGSKFSIVEEGTQLSGNYAVAYGAAVAEYKWFWAFKYEDSLSQDVSKDKILNVRKTTLEKA